MVARDKALQLAKFMGAGELELADGVRRLFEIYRVLPHDEPLRATLAPFAELNERFDLALAGYADMAQLTDDIRAAASALERALG